MTSPYPEKSSTVHTTPYVWDAAGVHQGVARVLQLRDQPYDWSFSGKISGADGRQFLKALITWTQKSGKIDLTDHLGRTFRLRFTAFTPGEKTPTPRSPWRFTYEAHATIYDIISEA